MPPVSLRLLLLACLAAPLCGQVLFPPPPMPAGNPSSAAKVLLGKALFWDEQLSSTRSVACGTCHVLGRGGADPRQARHPGPDGILGNNDDVRGSLGVSRHDAAGRLMPQGFGIRPQVTARKAPSVINAAYQAELFWDGRAATSFADPLTSAVLLPNDAALESQAAAPPISDVEMSHLGRTWNDIAQDLPALQPLRLADQLPPALQAFVAGQTYAALFQQVFGSPGVTPARIAMAIAVYERTLISDQSPFDLFLANQGTLTALQVQGLNVFRSLCSACHTDVNAAVLATGPVLNDFRNVGVRPIAEDPGRFLVTAAATDRGRFKVPGLRNVALRAPYFHNGGMAALGDVVDFYARGGDFHVNQDPLILNIPGTISVSDRLAIITFLQAMTDPRVQNELPPFDRPRLWSEGPYRPVVFGTGTIGSGNVQPRSMAELPPFTGNVKFTIGLDRAAPAAFTLLAWDVASSAVPTVVLGQNVYLALTPGLVFTGVGLTQGAGPGTGWSQATLAVPAAQQLQGLSLHGQWVVLDALGPFGLTVSDAFRLTVF